MHILVSNDDGFQAPGIEKLVEVLETIADISVVAPEINRSGASNSLTLENPLRARNHANALMINHGQFPCLTIEQQIQAHRDWSNPP